MINPGVVFINPLTMAIPMEYVRYAEWIFWSFVAVIVGLTTATILLDRGYLWP